MATRNEKIKLTISAKDKAGKKLSSIQKKIVGIGAAYLGWKAVTGIISGITKAGIEHEKVWTDVTASLKRHNLAVDSTIKEIRRFSDEMQTLSGISDEVIGKATQAFIDYGQDAKGAMDTVRVAMDLAAGGSMDLMAAVDLLAKASVGYTGTLSRYGIIIDENIPKAEKFAAAIEQINEKFGGAAQARAETIAVKMALVGQKVGDLKEALFKLFSPTLLTTIEVGISLVDQFIKIVSGTEDVSKAQRIMSETTFEVTSKLYELNRAFEDGEISLKDYASRYAEVMAIMGEQTKRAVIDIRKEDRELSQIFDVALGKLSERLAAGELSWDEFEKRVRTATGKVARWLKTDIIDPYEKMFETLENAANSVKTFATVILSFADVNQRAYERLLVVGTRYYDTIQHKVIELKKTQQAAILAVTVDQLLGYTSAQSAALEIFLSEGRWADAKREREIQMLEFKLTLWNKESEEYAALQKRLQNLTEEAEEAKQDIVQDSVNVMIQTSYRFSDAIVDSIYGTRLELQKIWNAMARDFISMFVRKILTELAATFAVEIVKILSFLGPHIENDRQIIRQGQLYAQFFKQGVISEMSRYALPSMMAGAPMPAMAFGGGGASSSIGPQVTVNVNAPITSDQFIDFVVRDMTPIIENASKAGQTKITIDPFFQTGDPSGVIT